MCNSICRQRRSWLQGFQALLLVAVPNNVSRLSSLPTILPQFFRGAWAASASHQAFETSSEPQPDPILGRTSDPPDPLMYIRMMD
ncbi:hypothetical protein IQ06DRAFT_295836 [Phaeosphaeriaceae sp. SRC1lsM3a]|nr:hypothetical protein IQ06DRAFT_295836 [Stagonospora sp. SRC1lsM3a]